ncbi:unnamed protein product [Penicillium viridicatum]
MQSHKPIAITSENGVEAFTRTSYYDSENTSGLGTAQSPPYLACVDEGVTWTKFAGNPIISAAQEAPHDTTKGLETRDPKVFFHEASGKWVMILAHDGQDKVTFWTSTNAKDWTYPIEGTDETTWVLILTPAQGSPAGGNGVLALTGSFDGETFKPDPVDPANPWLDYGRDFDGAMSWENVPGSDGRRILAAISNSYGATGSVRSFIQWPVSELLTAGPALATIQNQTITPDQVLLSSVVGTTLDIELAFVPRADAVLSLAVRKTGPQQTVIRYKQSTATLSVDRTASGDTSYDAAAGGVHSASLKPDDSGVVRIRVLVDTCSVEDFGGKGEVVISDLIFPDETADGLALRVSGGSTMLQSVVVREISLE